MTDDEKQIYREGVSDGILKSLTAIQKHRSRLDSTQQELSFWINAFRDAKSKRQIRNLCQDFMYSIRQDMITRLDNLP